MGIRAMYVPNKSIETVILNILISRQSGILINVCPNRELVGYWWWGPTQTSASMDMELSADLFHGQCGIMRQLYKAFQGFWYNQSHSYSPMWASDRVYPYRELGSCWYVPTHTSASMDTELSAGLFHGQCGIIGQLYKAFQSLWPHQSHSYSPI